jgi:Cu(I)/Ag(I) efflux system periplasmic protein CusF
MKRRMRTALAALLLASTLPVLAQALSDGEIRKVDKDAQKLTIKHGPLLNLDMPAMTMVFQVKDPQMLDRVKVGDKVKFEADMLSGGRLVVTRIEQAK